MIRAVDTNVLVYLAATDVSQHTKSRRSIEQFLSESAENRIAVTDDVILEFVHVVTDERRLRRPLKMAQALDLAEALWSAREVVALIPSPATLTRSLELLRSYKLSRKRIRDTVLAAILEENHIEELLTVNVADFRIFPFLKPIDPSR